MIEMLLYGSLLILPTVIVFSLLKAVEIIVNKDVTRNWKIYALISGICLTITCIAVAYFK